MEPSNAEAHCVNQRPTRWAPARPIVSEKIFAVLLVIPTLLILLSLTLYPIGYAFWISLHQRDLIRNRNAMPFVGLANYAEIITSEYFWDALGHTVHFTVASLLIQIPLGLMIALVLNERFRGRALVRAIIIIPWALPNIVNGVLWQWIYNVNYGALNGLLLQLGIIHNPQLWLSEPARALNMVIIADTWKVLPFYALMFLAALQTVPSDLYEAAQVDGAGILKRFTAVTVPFLRPTLLIVLVLRTVDTFRVFDIIYMLTQGGPGGGTRVLAFFTYEVSFSQLNFGVGSALAVIITLITMVIALGYFWLLRAESLY